MLSSHSSSEAVLTWIRSAASSVSSVYMGRSTEYLMATTLSRSASWLQSWGDIR